MPSPSALKLAVTAARIAPSNLEAALIYARRGFRILPANPDPKATGKPGYKGAYGKPEEATTDEATIREWWTRRPNALIWLLMGPENGLLALDVDSLDKHRPPNVKPIDGIGNYAVLLLKLNLPNLSTRRHSTPSNGQHHFFSYPDGYVIKGGAGSGLAAQGIDVRGANQGIIAPGPYVDPEYGRGWDAAMDEAPEPLPAALRDVLMGKHGGARPGAGRPKKERQEKPDDDEDAIVWPEGEGERQLNKLCEEMTLGEQRRIPRGVIVGTLVKGGAIEEGYARARMEDVDRYANRHRRPGNKAIRGFEYGLKKGAPATPPFAGVKLNYEDFFAYMPTGGFMFVPLRAFWATSSINARLKPKRGIQRKQNAAGEWEEKKVSIPASLWLTQHAYVTSMSWLPGEPEFIANLGIEQGGRVMSEGLKLFNLYRPPTIAPIEGDVSRYVDHWKTLFPDDWETALDWLAFKVQFPAQKINYALVIGGGQGIGKDTLLRPVKDAIGDWNFAEASPNRILDGSFNEYRRSVILRVSEARDLGEFDRYKFYEASKTLIAAPPEMLEVNVKFVPQYWVPNLVGVIITTNHKLTSLYLPRDDRRHLVLWTDKTKEDFAPEYWNEFWKWYDKEDGYAKVAHFLRTRDVAKYDPKAPPKQTEAFWAIVGAGESAETSDLADLIGQLNRPSVVTTAMLADEAKASPERRDDFIKTVDWLKAHPRSAAEKFRDAGYRYFRNKDSKDGRWLVGNRLHVIFARDDLSDREAYEALRIYQEAAKAKNKKSPSDLGPNVIPF